MTDSFYAGGGIGLGPRVATEVREPYPEPEVTSRMGIEGPERKAVTDLVRMGRAWGADVRIQYARGCFPHALLGTPGEVKDSLGVVMQRGVVRAVAVHVGSDTWAWGTLAVQIPGAPPERFTTLAEFLDGVFGPMHEPIRADRPIEGPARRPLKTWGPLRP